MWPDSGPKFTGVSEKDAFSLFRGTKWDTLLPLRNGEQAHNLASFSLLLEKPCLEQRQSRKLLSWRVFHDMLEMLNQTNMQWPFHLHVSVLLYVHKRFACIHVHHVCAWCPQK